MFYDMGYGGWKFDAARINERLLNAESKLALAADAGLYIKGQTLLAVHGTSGIWLAAAMVERGHHVCLVRKPNEGSHGRPIEAAAKDPDGRSRPKAVLLDDFVSSGETVRRVATLLWEHHRIPLQAVVCHDLNDGGDRIPIKVVPIYGYTETLPVF